MIRMPRLLALIVVLSGGLSASALMSTQARASGADDLLKAAAAAAANNGPAPTAPTAAGALPALSALDASQFKLDDPFMLRFFNTWDTWQLAGRLPFDVNTWSQLVLKARFDDAARQWAPLQGQLPTAFRQPALAARLYSLWKLGLSQTFLDQWLDAIRDPSFRSSPENLALEQTIAPGFDHWILDRAIVLTPDQKQFISGLNASRGFVDATLKAYASLRGGAAAIPLLPLLPAGDALKIPLSETATLALARQGDLAGAAHILKYDLEPALALKKDPRLLAKHYIEIARLLYQAGSLEGAEQYYEKIPTGIPSYFDAREELMWVWLRKGDNSRLRGELVSLGSPIYADRFDPELYLVRSISNLRLCFYDEVAKDFQSFIATNSKWAAKIAAAEKQTDPPKAENDFYTSLVERSLDHLRTEQAVLQHLNEQAALQNIQALIQSQQKQRSAEYRRQWENRRQILASAILKMKFVKVQYLSDVQTLAQNGDSISMSAAAPVARLKASEKAEQDQATRAQEHAIAKGGQMVFPFDGTYWADEVFRLRSLVHGRCLGAEHE